MQSKDILKAAIAFYKAAKEPSYDPEEIDIDYDPMDDYDRRNMEGLETTDVGSNYGYLTPPLPSFREDEATLFDTKATELYDEYKPNIDNIRHKLVAINTPNTIFGDRTKRALENIIQNINAFDTYVDQPELVVARLRENVRQAKYINKALSDLLEHNREHPTDMNISMLARCANSIVILGNNILKRLNKLLSYSRTKRQDRHNWDFDK